MKKYLILIAFIVVCFNAFPDSASAVWYSSSWTYRKPITIDPAQVAGSADHTSFPVLVDLTDIDLQAEAQADGDDILFTSSDGSTKLDHEIELYTTATGRLTAWVEIPTLDYDNDTIIYMYYGNSGASSQQNATGVWNSDYVFVHHLKDGTTLSNEDSTSNNFDGSNTGGIASTGKIDGGEYFDGSGDYVQTNDTFYDSGTHTAMTFSFWVNATATTDVNDVFFGRNFTPFLTQVTAEDVSNNFAYKTSVRTGTTGFCQPTTAAGTLTNGTWHYITGRYDGSTMKNYMNAVERASTACTGDLIVNSAQNIFYGAFSTSANNMVGNLDELRISSVARSPDWITTEYNNQSATSTFYTIGTQETDTPAAVPDYKRRLLGI